MKTKSIKFDDKLEKEIRKHAAEDGCSFSEWVRKTCNKRVAFILNVSNILEAKPALNVQQSMALWKEHLEKQ